MSKGETRGTLKAGTAMTGSPAGVEVHVLGHLIYYLPPSSRVGTKAAVVVPAGTALGYLPNILEIPVSEVQSFVVNGQAVKDPSYVLGEGDKVVLLPVISSG